MRTSALLFGLLACAGPETLSCERTCRTLVRDCDFAAFPNLDSCIDGCSADAAAGAHVDRFDACVLEASCDTLAVMSCARRAEAGT